MRAAGARLFYGKLCNSIIQTDVMFIGKVCLLLVFPANCQDVLLFYMISSATQNLVKVFKGKHK